MRTTTRHSDERGSIPIFMVVMVVVSTLVIVTGETIQVGLRSTRRAGDSANALQVADAGVNDAVQQAPTVPRTTTSFTRTGTLGSSGSYTYTAVRDAVRRDLWHVDVIGTDRAGLRRRIKADALPASLFSSPLFVNSTLDLSSGISLDSFSSGVSTSAMCTGKGIIGTNEPTTMTFGTVGQGGGVANCKKLLGIDPSWSYAMDGCTSYGDGSQALPPIGTGRCPPDPHTFRTPPRRFTPSAVYPPGTANNTKPADFKAEDHTLVCDPAETPRTDTAAKRTFVASLIGGKIYHYGSAVLRGGCSVANPVLSATGGVDLDQPVFLYAHTRVDIGNPTGQGGLINRPPAASTSVCGATANSTLVDGTNPANPAYYYCPLWSASLRIRMVSGASNVVNIRSSGTKFWGSVEVPTGAFTLTGSQIEVWGAAASNTASSNAQFTWHFDDALVNVSTGQYGLSTWREEPLP